MNIKLNIEGSKGVAEAYDGDEKAGEMTFSIASDHLIIIDHTAVESSYRGQGVGEKLLNKVVDWSRENNVKIMPLCPFANSVFKKNENLQDVLN